MKITTNTETMGKVTSSAKFFKKAQQRFGNKSASLRILELNKTSSKTYYVGTHGGVRIFKITSFPMLYITIAHHVFHTK